MGTNGDQSDYLCRIIAELQKSSMFLEMRADLQVKITFNAFINNISLNLRKLAKKSKLKVKLNNRASILKAFKDYEHYNEETIVHFNSLLGQHLVGGSHLVVIIYWPDHHLRWNSFANCVVARAKRILGFIKRTSKGLRLNDFSKVQP